MGAQTGAHLVGKGHEADEGGRPRGARAASQEDADQPFRLAGKQGKKVLKDAVADVQDASVPIVFADYHLIMVATAKFSDTKPEENVYYVGAFQRWFNVSSGIINWAISMDRLVRQTLGQ